MTRKRKKRGGLYRQRDSPYWYADYIDADGLRKRRSTGKTTKKEAERVRAKWLNERSQVDNDPSFTELVSDLKADYEANAHKSWYRVRQALTHLEPAFGNKTASRISARSIAAYRNARSDAGARPATVRYELAVLQRMLSVARDNDKLAAIPKFPSVRVNNAREEYITEAEFAGLLVELPEHLRSYIAFRYHSGWRGSETANITWDDVDWENGLVWLRRGTTKNDEPRAFPFANFPALRSVLEQQRKYTDNCERRVGGDIPWLFHRNGNKLKHYRRSWIQACKRVGAIGKDGQPKVPHDLRRSAARRMEQAGIPRSISRRLIGHKTESVFQRYAVVASDDLRQGTEKLAALDAPIRHTIGIVGRSEHQEGAPAETRTPWEVRTYEDSGGGSRTPDTRIMIPLL